MTSPTALRDIILNNLKSAIHPSIVDDLVAQYEKLIAEYRKGDAEAALNASGKFVEHALRAVEFIRSGVVLSEIKSVAGIVREFEKDASLDEALRILVPKISSAMMFDVRSKSGAAHVKPLDPRHIDAALVAQAASWTLSEFLRRYHVQSEAAVAQAIDALMRGNAPLIETIGGERVITMPLPCETEILLRAFMSEPEGIDRRGLGSTVRHSPPAITRAVQKLVQQVYLYRTKDGMFHITGPGEQILTGEMAKFGRSVPLPKRL